MDLDLDDGGSGRDGVDPRSDLIALGSAICKLADTANIVAPQLYSFLVVCAPLATHPAYSVVLAAVEFNCYLELTRGACDRLLCARDAICGACPRAGGQAVLQEITVDLPSHIET
jgi:hypothetical protein